MSALATSVTLLRRLENPNDNDAWERFVRVYTPLIKVWVMRYVDRRGNPALRSEVDRFVNDIISHVWTNFPKGSYQPEKGSFRAWLSSVASNALKDEAKKRFRDKVAYHGGDEFWEWFQQQAVCDDLIIELDSEVLQEVWEGVFADYCRCLTSEWKRAAVGLVQMDNILAREARAKWGESVKDKMRQLAAMYGRQEDTVARFVSDAYEEIGRHLHHELNRLGYCEGVVDGESPPPQ